MKLTLEQRKKIQVERLREELVRFLAFALFGVMAGRVIGLASSGVQHSIFLEVLITVGLLSVPVLLAAVFYHLTLRRIAAMKDES